MPPWRGQGHLYIYLNLVDTTQAYPIIIATCLYYFTKSVIADIGKACKKHFIRLAKFYLLYLTSFAVWVLWCAE
jgi:hypothetical protein